MPQSNTQSLHSSVDGVQMPGPSDNLPWLNHVDQVHGIVRTFAAELLERYGKTQDEESSPEDFMKWLERECFIQNQVFIGGGTSERPYQADRLWNTPDQLGEKLLINLRMDGENRHAVRQAFMVLADRLTTIVDENAGAATEDYGWQLDGEIERLGNALLGMPADTPEPGDDEG